MGVNLRDLFARHPVPDGWYAHKRIAVDGHNVAFRYLTSIRGKDGGPLRNADGRVTSHLYGFLGLVKTLRMAGAEPVIVWDGDIHPLKRATVQGRIDRRLEAALNAEEALAAGDHDAHRRYMRATTYLDAAMIEDCSRILAPLGVATVRAPHDGERYAAALCLAGHADAVATEDYDALVAGAPLVLRKAGSVDPFLHQLSDLAGHGLTATQLRHVAILCGTDWHPGINGFGAKTALKALKDHPDLRELVAQAHAGHGDSRYHTMVRDGSMSLEEFDRLDAYVADIPVAPAPVRGRPDPQEAASEAKRLGIGEARVMGCFC